MVRLRALWILFSIMRKVLTCKKNGLNCVTIVSASVINLKKKKHYYKRSFSYLIVFYLTNSFLLFYISFFFKFPAETTATWHVTCQNQVNRTQTYFIFFLGRSILLIIYIFYSIFPFRVDTIHLTTPLRKPGSITNRYASHFPILQFHFTSPVYVTR